MVSNGFFIADKKFSYMVEKNTWQNLAKQL